MLANNQVECKLRGKAGATYYIVSAPESFNCVSCIDQVEVSMARHEQVISAQQTQGGAVVLLFDEAIV